MNTRRISTTAVLLLSSLSLIIGTGEAFAQQRPGIRPFVATPEGCYLTEPAEPESLFSFTKIELQALWMARRGELANLEVLTAREDLPMDQTAKMMTGLREELIGNTCAAFILSAYAESANESLASAAKFLVLSYQVLKDMDNQMLQMILQGTRDKDGTATRARLSEWKNRRRDILDKMAAAVDFSLSLLVDHSRTDAEGNPGHMILTKAQRDALLNYLISKFPSLDKEKRTAHYGDLIEQAALIQSFLTGKYKPADNQ